MKSASEISSCTQWSSRVYYVQVRVYRLRVRVESECRWNSAFTA